MITIETVAAPTAEVRALLAELDRLLATQYDEDQRHGLSVDELFRPDVRFFLARLDGEPAGCGGVAFYDGYAEVKRMFTSDRWRGRGLAKALLHRIEAEARHAGAPVLLLETGVYQHEAVGLYERVGFRRRGPFGPYATKPSHAIELSLFFEKTLRGAEAVRRPGPGL